MPQLRPLFPGYLRDHGTEPSDVEHDARYSRNTHGIFTWGNKIKGVQTTVTTNTACSSRTQRQSRNPSEVELNAIEVETETIVTRTLHENNADEQTA